MIILLVFPALYCILLLVSIILWARIPSVGVNTEARNSFSVLIPFRNEEQKLESLMNSLLGVDYPADQFEVIFINDHSSDGGEAMIESACNNYQNWKIINLKQQTGKKSALLKGVQEARYPILITTDADCNVRPGWLRTYDQAYTRPDTHFVAGTIELAYEKPTLPVIFQVFEQYALTGLTGVTMHSRYPTMCNGANLSFTKEAFLAVNGYEGNEQIPSGDDQFLLKKVTSRFHDSAIFMKDPQAAVRTGAITEWDEMLHQRIRWAAKWKSTGGMVSVMAVFIALTYFSLLVSLFFTHQSMIGEYLPGILLTKLFADALFVAAVAGKRIHAGLYIYWPIIQVIYPFYTLFVVWKSIRGNYIWKDRRYSSAV
ncbi:glycosyltransferase [Fulvivirga sedimenti]|uniref:Glycosyltransferase n=1 Tax=Fulvivirga sedimenti TaxID=2879465 RepID=A0A9X1KZP0_9BACT|nr:glycosyltransferase [Fulvivirga sedimenti]MCA6075220.1 glycosyltransferase [Fulvivirga sedimenti]MCA6076397.1 glycosyltransferase [Fulvivirga sedimenti]MCA6077525.1 glycosyltransferase [Fulvivirga sedimenti]